MEENKTPFDAKTIVIILLIPVFFWGWSKYLSYKYPQKSDGNTTANQVLSPSEKSNVTGQTGGDGETISGSKVTVAAASIRHEEVSNLDSKNSSVKREEAFKIFKNDNVSFRISNYGMAITDFTLLKYSDRDGNNLKFGTHLEDQGFELRYNDKPIVFEISEAGVGSFQGVAEIGSLKLFRSIIYNSEKNFFKSKVWIESANGETVENLGFEVSEPIRQAKSKSIFFPSYEKQDFFVRESGKSKSINFSDKSENQNETFSNVSLAGISSQYFTMSLLDESEIIPEVMFSTDLGTKKGRSRFLYKGKLQTGSFLNQVIYIGPKGIDQLKAAHPGFVELLDFGVFSVIAGPMLYLMKALHSIAGNWGFAIIILTLIVRFVVLPFNIMSYKSMKAMQKIQPILADLRVRYKEDPVTLNKEMYALMKEHKANPMGGCLPMLLQIPIFFALFRVIGSSVELYKSPFFGWILDLSSKDPYYVLPVLMGATMFIQQKLTPTNMDPNQAKVMAFMPLIFSLFMFQMPSGLTLYMFVSGLFGITQQYLFMRERKA